MTKQDRQKLGILVVLLAVLGVTAVFAYRMNQPEITAAVQSPTPRPSANAPAASDARIRIDLLENTQEADIGKRNVFTYRQAPAPPPSSLGRGALGPSSGPPQTPIQQPPPAVKAGPPPPPPIPLRFQGFAVTTGRDAGLTAFLADDQRHFNVRAGEILMGRYRIVSISEKAVEVEDLEYNRRQILPLLK
jgi:hypothetical protein